MCLATGQRNKVRHIRVMGRYGSKGCTGSLEELGACGPGRQDCELSKWTAWDACDHTCGTGQQQRNRQINNQPEGGGLKCGKNLVETQVCDNGPCGDNDCVWGDWSAFSACTAACGSGQSTRTREIRSKRKTPTGVGCKGNSIEEKPCKADVACQAVDCTYGDWSRWDTCTKECGGGQQYRTRAPNVTALPSSGGAACPILPKQEVQGCNTKPCSVHRCKDTTFGRWSKWTQCTSDCMGGIKSRTRSIIRGNDCGKSVTGRTHEVTPCWTDKPCDLRAAVDCKFASWTNWTACSATCSGTQERSRTIERMGQGTGGYCVGPLRQIMSCNPVIGSPLGSLSYTPTKSTEPAGRASPVYNAGTIDPACPIGDDPIDCKQSLFSGWSECLRGQHPVTCGGGQQIRTRHITQFPQLGGADCNYTRMAETQPCAQVPCTVESDCTYAFWSEWNGCDACRGQQSRSRTMSHPSPRGKACNASVALGETRQCTNSRHCANEVHYCVWQNWDQWSSCQFVSSDPDQCGTGHTTRKRSMVHSRTPPAAAPVGASRLYETDDSSIAGDVHDEEDDEDSRLSSLALAFAAGGASVGLCMVVLRLNQRTSRVDRQQYESVSSEVSQ